MITGLPPVTLIHNSAQPATLVHHMPHPVTCLAIKTLEVSTSRAVCTWIRFFLGLVAPASKDVCNILKQNLPSYPQS